MPEIPLPTRSVIFQRDLDDLLAEWKGRHIANGECARLPQVLTDVGHTSRWQPGPKVCELAYILPGTVIANFKFDSNGRACYPNAHGYHAALFQKFTEETMSTGKKSLFRMIDQWAGDRPKYVSSRPVAGYTPEEARNKVMPCDNANEFYVVVVP
jgi:hypothetical protein